MRHTQMDHFITYASVPSIDDHLDRWRRAGFSILPKTVRHEPGLRNGFVGFNREYIEFCWVEDESQFSVVGPEERALREASRPYSIGISTPDVQALHDDWVARGYEPAPVWSKARQDAASGAAPEWSFQEIPPVLRPEGAECFVLSYHGHLRDGADQLQVAANTIYAISGALFVTPQPAERARAWGHLLDPNELVQDNGETCSLQLGPHLGTWMTPARYEKRFGRSWEPVPHPYGELAALHLLAEHLETAEDMLSGAGRSVSWLAQADSEPASLFVAPEPSDGFAFVITERAASEWLAERTARFGDPFS